MTQQPQAKYRHDYRAPEYLISDIDLTFDLDAAKTVVTAESKVSRHAAASDVPLRLDGEDLTLIALQVNGQPWSDYKEENNQLVIGGLPEHFTLTIVNEISPELLVSSRLDALINYDRENKTELYRTLQVYLEHERNSLQTAKTLFIHRSSLVYRLERIQKITKIDLDNPRNRLLLQICFLLIQEKEPASD